MEKTNALADLKLAEVKKENLRKACDTVQSQASSILLLTLQWKDLEEHFDSIQKSIELRVNEVDIKEKQLKERDEEVESKEQRLSSIEKEAEERSKELDSVRETVRECLKELELKEKELDLARSSIQERENEVESKGKQLDLLRRSTEEWRNELQFKEEELKALQLVIGKRDEEVRLKRKRLEDRSEKVELKERHLEDCAEEVQFKEKELESLLEEVNLKQKQLDDRTKEVELKDKQLELTQKSVEERAKDVEVKEKELRWILQSIEERSKEVQIKEKQCDSSQTAIDQASKAVELKEKQLISVQETVGLCLKELELKEEQFYSTQRSVAQRADEVSLKEKEVSLMQNSIEVRQKELDMKKEQLDAIQKTVDECLKELELKEGQINSVEKSVEERCKEVQQKEKLLESIQKSIQEHARELKLKEQPIYTLHSKVKVEQPECFPAYNWTDSSYANLQFCVTMDGRSLQLFLNDRFDKHDVMRDEIYAALQMSSDPAKLVLDAMQGFYPSSSNPKTEDMSFEINVIRRSCILLLEQLMRVSPQIKPHVKDEGMKLAVEWKSKMKVGTGNYLEVFGFLQLLATYGLISEFGGDEILKLVETVARHRKAPELCRVLGFEDKVPELIRNLIQRNQALEAISFICEFKLLDMFPPAHILKCYLRYSKKVAKRICLKGDNSLKAQHKARDKEVAALRAVIKCISDHKLESEYPSRSLEKRIMKLEKPKAYNRHTAPDTGPNIQPQGLDGMKHTTSAPCLASKVQPEHEGGSKLSQSAVLAGADQTALPLPSGGEQPVTAELTEVDPKPSLQQVGGKPLLSAVSAEVDPKPSLQQGGGKHPWTAVSAEVDPKPFLQQGGGKHPWTAVSAEVDPRPSLHQGGGKLPWTAALREVDPNACLPQQVGVKRPRIAVPTDIDPNSFVPAASTIPSMQSPWQPACLYMNQYVNQSTSYLRTYAGCYNLDCSSPVIPHMYSSALRYGLDVASYGGFGQFNLADAPSGNSNLSARHYGMTGTPFLYSSWFKP